MPIDEIKLSGNHYEVGVQQGRICYLLYGKLNMMKILRSLSFVQAAAPISGPPFYYVFGQLLARGGRKMLKTIASEMPNQYDKIEGMGEGYGVTAEKMAQILYFESFSGDCRNDMGVPKINPPSCCAGIVVKEDQGFLIKNFDFPHELQEYQNVRYVHLTGNCGYSYVSMGISAVPHVISGLNEKGLAISLNSGYSSDILHSAIPSGVICQEIMETCKTVEEAKEILMKIPLSAGWIFLLFDRNHKGLIVERTAHHAAFREFAIEKEGMYLAAANSLIHPEIKPYQLTDETIFTVRGPTNGLPVIKLAEWRRVRMETMLKALLNKNGKIEQQDLTRILSDHENLPGDTYKESICRHGDLFKTLSSIIIEPKANCFWYSDGNMCSNPEIKKAPLDFSYSKNMPKIRFMRKYHPDLNIFDPLIG